jgi:hypothetical protein
MGKATRIRKTRMGPMGLMRLMRPRPISHMSPIGPIRVSARQDELPVAVLALGAASRKGMRDSTFPPTALTPAGKKTDRPRNSA